MAQGRPVSDDLSDGLRSSLRHMKNLFQAVDALRDFLSGGYGLETRETYPAPFFPGERSTVPLFSFEINMMKFKEKTVSCVCVCV